MTPLRLQIAFITGRSRPDNSALSPAQDAFLQNLLSQQITPVAVNFPWAPSGKGFQSTGILRASLNNAREYLCSRGPSFTARYQKMAINLLGMADHTLLLSGSCGLELFNNLQIPETLMPRVSVFAYGPVARRRPACRHMLVQGGQDRISRLWFTQVDARIPCRHMDYLTRPELAALCRRFLDDIYQRQG